MLYSFELVMLGILLLSAMLVCGVIMRYRRMREADMAREGLPDSADSDKAIK